MENLTKQQRLKVYERMLKILKNNYGSIYYYGLCTALQKAQRRPHIFKIEDYPELIALKPKKYSFRKFYMRLTGNSVWWWPPQWQKLRQRKLKKIIKQLEKSINTSNEMQDC